MIVTEVAKKYIGETETPRNSGFNNSIFEAKMVAVGFQEGHAWCAYFTELVFKEAYPQFAKELDKLFSASTIATFRNFKNAGYRISLEPQPDNLVIWQNYKDGVPQATGHAGIVSWVDIDKWHFRSIEGNTSSKGVREGYIVGEQSRKVLANVNDGLKVLGFITIPKI